MLEFFVKVKSIINKRVHSYFSVKFVKYNSKGQLHSKVLRIDFHQDFVK